MSLYERKESQNYYYKPYCPRTGKALQGSTGTADKTKAQEFHDRLKASLWDEVKTEEEFKEEPEEEFEEKPQYLWQHAVLEYLEPRQNHSSIASIKSYLNWLEPWLKDKALDDINEALISKIKAAKQQDVVHIRTKRQGKKSMGRKVQPSTVNKVLKSLLTILRIAVRRKWLDQVPTVDLLPELKKRVRWLTQDEAQRLLSVLPSHLADMTQFSLETGLRRANVTGLEWTQIDLVKKIAWIHPDQAKARKAICVPLSDEAISILKRQMSKRRDADYTTSVFVYRGKPVKQTSTKAWYKALKAVGINDFKWHDLRHTWASWHVQRGTPLYVLKELGGWETLEMVQRYAHLSSEHLSQWVHSHTVFAPLSVHDVPPEKAVA